MENNGLLEEKFLQDSRANNSLYDENETLKASKSIDCQPCSVQEITTVFSYNPAKTEETCLVKDSNRIETATGRESEPEMNQLPLDSVPFHDYNKAHSPNQAKSILLSAKYKLSKINEATQLDVIGT